MKNNKSASLFEKEQVLTSLKQSFVKLNPRIMVKNPIMFTVEVCTAIMFLVMIYSIFDNAQGSFVYNAWVFVILFITLLFANFAEAIAEARGKAQADSLRKTREETPAKLLVNGQIKTTSSSQLKKGDVFMKKTICFLTCVLMAVLVPVTGMALGGNAVYSSALEAMENAFEQYGYQWYDPVETRETLENLYAYDVQESASETILSAMFISRPMWGWSFRYDIEARIRANGDLISLQAWGPLNELVDTLNGETDMESYLVFVSVITAFRDNLSSSERSKLENWVENEALPFLQGGYQTDAEPSLQVGGGELYCCVSWGECQMPWCLAWYSFV